MAAAPVLETSGLYWGNVREGAEAEGPSLSPGENLGRAGAWLHLEERREEKVSVDVSSASLQC